MPAGDLLKARCVGVTHSGEGADWLVQACRERSYRVVHVPLTEFVPVADRAAFQQVSALPAGSWLVISSPQGARALAQVFQPPHLSALRLAAVGEGTARQLGQQGWRVKFVPSEASGAALGRELPASSGETVLHLTSDRAKDDLQAALARRGLLYQRLTLYHTRPAPLLAAQRAALLGADLVTLASSSAAEQFARCGGQGVAVAVMGQQTARTARELGFQRVLVASRPGLPELLAVVEEYFALRPGS